MSDAGEPDDFDDAVLSDVDVGSAVGEESSSDGDTSSSDGSDDNTAEEVAAAEMDDTAMIQQQRGSSGKGVKISLIEGDDRMTLNCMTKYEYAMAIAYRAEQIEDGAAVLPGVFQLRPELSHSLDIAKYELDHFKHLFPNYILRPIFDAPKRKIYEKWFINELIIPRELLCLHGSAGAPDETFVLNKNCKNVKRDEFNEKALKFATLRHYT
jgi:DNA-directed RNA polymerase subunit K/omega